jgi:hypothetical protein
VKKETYALTVCAAGLFSMVVFHAERRFFITSSSQVKIRNKAESVSKKTSEARIALEAVYAVAEDPRQYVLVDPEVEALKNQQGESVAAVETDSLRVTGLMKTSDQVLAAVVNGSLVGPGDNVLGCEIKEISNEGVLFSVDGVDVLVPMKGEFKFTAAKTGAVIVEKVSAQEGRNLAVINGRTYKVGDWVNRSTQVKAIAPTAVMFSVKGENKTVRIGEVL